MTTHTRSSIEALFENPRTQAKAITRAILFLYSQQTDAEKSANDTLFDNSVGFNSSDGRMGTSMGKFAKRRGYLTPKQIAYWTRRQKSGKMRIQKYSNQLLQEAKRKTLHD